MEMNARNSYLFKIMRNEKYFHFANSGLSITGLNVLIRETCTGFGTIRTTMRNAYSIGAVGNSTMELSVSFTMRETPVKSVPESGELFMIFQLQRVRALVWIGGRTCRFRDYRLHRGMYLEI